MSAARALPYPVRLAMVPGDPMTERVPMTATDTADPTLDMTACDREPIHIPGAIQPQGLLLVADAATLDVVAGAGDIEGRLTPDWLGRPLGSLIAQPVDPARLPMVGEPTTGTAERFSVALHRTGDRIVAELEPSAADPMSAAAVIGMLDTFAAAFERAGDLQALCDRAAAAFRQITGYDRVMIYRFLDEGAGRVIAEDQAPDLGSFLHHHFPATDIPAQARALYVRNRTRAIPDVAYRPAPLRPAGFEALDMSDVGLRSVSPVHVQYLKNMGVGASASISIVKDDVLWGLVACHNAAPRALPLDLRATASILAGGLARQIRAKEEAETYRERLRLRGSEDAVVATFGSGGDMRALVSRAGDELRRMFGGDGFAFVRGGDVETFGTCPSEADVVDLARWSRSRGVIEPFATHELSAVYRDAKDFRETGSGMLALPLIDDGTVMLWFRAELIEEIEWAGNPHKAVALGRGETLTPRASFESWSETVRGRSRRWTREEIEAAHRLRRTLHDLNRNEKLRTLNGELQRTLSDKDALIAQKDVLVKEVNHRVQNSLQLVAAFLRLQAKAAGEGEVADQLGEAQARLSAVALVHRRLYRDDQVETVDLARYLEELLGDMKVSMGDGWAAAMRLDLAPVLMPTDRAVNVGLILTELVINAGKYAYGGAPGPLTIVLEQHRSRIRLIVADEGRGKTGTSEGFGSRMMEAMIGRLAGTIDHVDNRPGLRVIVTLPIEETTA